MKSCLPSLLLIALNFFPGAHAQTAQEVFSAYYKDWFQIEVIIFERIENRTGDPEAWPRNLTLGYPDNLVFFNASGEQEAQSSGEDNSVLLENLRKADALDPINMRMKERIEKAEIQRLTPKESPYTFLPKENRILNDEAQRLQRHQAMRVLFHQAWRQPVYALESAPAIVVTGGDKFNQHYELEGTLTFSLSRFLHIHTKLWLTQFEANYGQEIANWPTLPTLPQAGLDKIMEVKPKAQEKAQETESWGVNLNADLEQTNLETPDGIAGLNSYQSIANQPFVIKHIIGVEQTRRMRSTELHYLDHPKLGILVRIDPYRPKFTGSN